MWLNGISSSRQNKTTKKTAQDYAARGEVSVKLGHESKCASFYLFIILSTMSSAAAAIWRRASVCFTFSRSELLTLVRLCWWEDAMLSKCETAAVRWAAVREGWGKLPVSKASVQRSLNFPMKYQWITTKDKLITSGETHLCSAPLKRHKLCFELLGIAFTFRHALACSAPLHQQQYAHQASNDPAGAVLADEGMSQWWHAPLATSGCWGVTVTLMALLAWRHGAWWHTQKMLDQQSSKHLKLWQGIQCLYFFL